MTYAAAPSCSVRLLCPPMAYILPSNPVVAARAITSSSGPGEGCLIRQTLTERDRRLPSRPKTSPVPQPLLQPLALVRGDPPAVAAVRSPSLFGSQSPKTGHRRSAPNDGGRGGQELISPWSQVRISPPPPENRLV